MNNKDHLFANGHEMIFKHNSTWKTHLEKLCRDTLRPGHPMEICCFKSHKLKVIFGHLLFNMLHSGGELRYSRNLSAVLSVICKIKNGSRALEPRRLESSDLGIMIISKSIIYSGPWLSIRDTPFLLCLHHIPKNIVSKQPRIPFITWD